MEKTKFQEGEDTDYAEDEYQGPSSQNYLSDQQDYLERLKTQRKRIEELCDILQKTQFELKKEKDCVRSLKEEVESIRSKEVLIFSSKTNSSSVQTSALQQQNQVLKDELLQVNAEKSKIISRLREEINKIRSCSNEKTETFEEELASCEEKLQEKTKAWNQKEREFNEVIESLKENIEKNKLSHSQTLKTLQIKFEQAQKEKKQHSIAKYDPSNKENSSMREEIQRLTSIIMQMEEEGAIQNEKHKSKLNTLKKQLKQKDKENIDIKDITKKLDKERKEFIVSLQEVKSEMRKNKQSSDSYLIKCQNEWAIERSKFQNTINKHMASIEDLLCIKDELAAQNSRLIRILRQKEQLEKQRKIMLRNECKEIDRLERVIDKITD